MPENAQLPATQNPSKADASYLDYEPTFRAFNYFQIIVNNLPVSTYELSDIQTISDFRFEMHPPGADKLSANYAAELMMPYAQQLQTSADTGIANLAGFILSWCQTIVFDQQHGTENAQIRSDQSLVEIPSEVAYSNANWQSDFDALSGIQYLLNLVTSDSQGFTRPWPPAIQSCLDKISGCCKDLYHNPTLCNPFRGLTPSDAARLIAPLAIHFRDLYPEPGNGLTPTSMEDSIWLDMDHIVNDCKAIDPSSVSLSWQHCSDLSAGLQTTFQCIGYGAVSLETDAGQNSEFVQFIEGFASPISTTTVQQLNSQLISWLGSFPGTNPNSSQKYSDLSEALQQTFGLLKDGAPPLVGNQALYSQFLQNIVNFETGQLTVADLNTQLQSLTSS
jgi:hypothetical protein